MFVSIVDLLLTSTMELPLLLLTASIGLSRAIEVQEEARPHIVIIVADDLVKPLEHTGLFSD